MRSRRRMGARVEADDRDASEEDLLGEVVSSGVRRGADKDSAATLGDEVEGEGGGSLGLTGTGRALDKGEGVLEGVLDSLALRKIKRLQPGSIPGGGKEDANGG